jgi:hypothetical protein
LRYPTCSREAQVRCFQNVNLANRFSKRERVRHGGAAGYKLCATMTIPGSICFRVANAGKMDNNVCNYYLFKSASVGYLFK